jgi:hypothetical protein
MATTIAQSFLKLKENLEITGLQAATVSTRQQTVREAMEADIAVLDSFLTGSYSRSTMIAALKDADIDIFIVLEAKYFHHYNNGQNGGQAGLLDLVKRTLRKTYTRTRYFRSFHLEVLALEILGGVTISDFPSGVRYYFDKARSAVAGKNLDPAGYGGDVGSYINSQEKIQEAAGKFQTAFDRALRAETSASRGNIKEAVDTWIKVFGDCFPAYG